MSSVKLTAWIKPLDKRIKAVLETGGDFFKHRFLADSENELSFIGNLFFAQNLLFMLNFEKKIS